MTSHGSRLPAAPSGQPCATDVEDGMGGAGSGLDALLLTVAHATRPSPNSREKKMAASSEGSAASAYLSDHRWACNVLGTLTLPDVDGTPRRLSACLGAWVLPEGCIETPRPAIRDL